MLTVEFQRTLDDLVAFSLFARERLGLNRHQKRYELAFGVLILGGAAAWHYRSTGMPIVFAVYAAVGVVYAFAWSWWLKPRVARFCARRGVRLLYGARPTTTHHLTITDAGVQEASSEGDTFVSWSGIPEIARTERHLFIFTGPASAHIVPLAAFRSPGDAEAFLRELQSRKA